MIGILLEALAFRFGVRHHGAILEAILWAFVIFMGGLLLILLGVLGAVSR
jgi:hypothetical protein